MNQALIEYAINAAWQLPVLAAGAWLLVRAAKPAPAVRHRIWIVALALAVALPFLGMLTHTAAHVTVIPASTSSSQVAPAPLALQSPADLAPHNRWLAETEAALASLRFTRRIQISPQTAQWIAGLYLFVLLFGLMRILRAWRGARQLVRHSLDAVMTRQEQVLVAECARRMGVSPPRVRTVHPAGALPAPAVVGAARPVLLCPKGFVRQLLDAGREDEATAALLHEMAHIRRQDYAVNLICEAWAAPLRWHPVTYAVTRQIRESREMACDAAAALAMNSEAAYARCLIGLAEQIATRRIVQQSGAMGLFHGNALEKRIMRLIDEHKPIGTQAKIARGAVGAAAMAAAVALAAMLQVVPARAQAAPIAAPTVQAAPAPQVAPVAKPSPAVAPQVQTQKVPKPVPAPNMKQAGRHKVILSQDGKAYAWVDGHKHKLTPAEQARIEKQIERAQKQIAKQQALLNSPQFKEQIEQAEHQARMAQRQLQSGEVQRQLAEAQKRAAAAEARINSSEFKAQLAEARKQAAQAEARLQSPQFRKQMEAIQKNEFNHAEMQRKLARALKQQAAAMARINNSEMEKQLKRALRSTMKAQRKAMEAQRKLESGQIQKQLEQSRKNLQKQLDQLRKQQLQDRNPGPGQP